LLIAMPALLETDQSLLCGSALDVFELFLTFAEVTDF
jgi:hypothetical protein